MSIALVHLLFNMSGMTLVLAIPRLREVPVRLAEHFAGLCVERRFYAIVYLVGVFFALPVVLLLGWRAAAAVF